MARHFTASSNEYINVGGSSSSSLNVSSGFTCAAWVKLDSVGNEHKVIARWDDNNGGSIVPAYILDIQASPAVVLMVIGNGANTFGQTATGGTTLTTGVWYHIAGGWSAVGGLNTGYVWLNGVLDGTSGLTGFGNIASNSIITLIGAGQNTGATPPIDHPFDGTIADAAVWNVLLTATELLGLANGIRPGAVRPQNLAGWWPLTGLASPEPDISGNFNNGTLTGTTPTFGPPITMFTPRWAWSTPPLQVPSLFILMPQIVT